MRDAAFADLFGRLRYTVHLLGEGQLYAFAAKRCLRTENQSLRNTTLAIRPVSSAVSMVTKP